jgi:PIF1-like helicase
LPVVKYGTKSDILNASLLSSPLWPHILPNFLKLERNMRVGVDADEQDFAKWQRLLANGLLNDSDDNVTIPSFLLCPTNSLSELIKYTYPDISTRHEMNYFRERCILTPRNREAHEINDVILDAFPGEVHDLWSVDEAFDPDTEMATETSYPPEVLHSASPSGFPQAHLRLKIGCPVIVLRNLHSEEGICNGSRGIVTRISTRVVEVLLHNGETCLIPRIKLICSDAQLPFHLHRRQFPLAVSFMITINKSQGQSFSTVGIDLQVPAFMHGQVYVAFSRGRSCKTVKSILNEDTCPRTKNVVYKEAIL